MRELVELLSNIVTELELVEVRCTEWPSITCHRAFKDAIGGAVARINRGLIPRNLMLVERWAVFDEHVKLIYELVRIRPFQVLARVVVHSMVAGRADELRHAVYVIRALSVYDIVGEVRRPKTTRLSEFLP